MDLRKNGSAFGRTRYDVLFTTLMIWLFGKHHAYWDNIVGLRRTK